MSILKQYYYTYYFGIVLVTVKAIIRLFNDNILVISAVDKTTMTLY